MPNIKSAKKRVITSAKKETNKVQVKVKKCKMNFDSNKVFFVTGKV